MSGEELFRRYKLSDTFIETGTNVGNGVYNALRAGYTNIVSIEKNGYKHYISKQRFGDNEKVNLVLGSSVAELNKLCITKPVTFWLDAHSPGRSISQITVLAELAVISQSLYTHNIIIDDVDLMGDLTPINTIIYKMNKKYLMKFVTLIPYRQNQIGVWSIH